MFIGMLCTIVKHNTKYNTNIQFSLRSILTDNVGISWQCYVVAHALITKPKK